MSTSSQAATQAENHATGTSQNSALGRWLREPLVHFIVLGALLFSVDHWLVSGQDDPNTIVMGAEVDEEARRVFKAARGVEPDAVQLAALRKVWLDNEVLYREGLALQVDKGDTGIRDRVIFKALNIIGSNLQRPAFDDKILRDWFESRREKYDEPARFDFEEAVLSDDNTEEAARAFAAALNAGTPGDAKAGLRVFKGRPKANVLQSYGAEFTEALETSPVGEWRAHQTKDGWRVVQLTALTPGKPAVFENLQGVVLQDWTDVVMAEQRSAAVDALAKKYTIRIEGEAK
ncbi:MAG: peptidylprolyl isomerase [Hydrogenophaga sp.]|uniref:peptidylprolyl isomerase n=1 Tax=Hydrogenophaga sp. TaxID=1904254 RepID=UPI002AB9E69F|nr:peptidylprolyl isomerase [Hydrogenophaga sp.]MDZ4104339.1 peptidylprolyl isomerase [Hydrogenophaga sp.]